MAIDPDAHNIDPFARALPGQSLTEDPDSAPYLKPPATASVKQAFRAIMQGIHNPVQKESLCNIMRAGLSCETIASDIVMQAFANGVCTPDMAELMKPPLVIALVGIAKDNGIERVRVGNQPLDMPVGSEEVSNITQNMSPMDKDEIEGNKLNERIFNSVTLDESEEDIDIPEMSEGFIRKEMPVDEERI